MSPGWNSESTLVAGPEQLADELGVHAAIADERLSLA